MTGLELIIAALVAGAASGTSNAVSTAVGDAYAAFRDALHRRLTGRPAAGQLDAEPTDDPDVWQARLGPDLRDTGADRDEQILAAARRVLDSVAAAPKYRVSIHGSTGVQIGDGNIMHIGPNHGPAAGT